MSIRDLRLPLIASVFASWLVGCGGGAAAPTRAPNATPAHEDAEAPVAIATPASAPWTLTILHTNDVHSRMDPVKNPGDDARENGGIFRRKAAVEHVRKERGRDNVLLVDAGDFSMGTAWYAVWGGAESVFAMNASGYDAATLGNHEFDRGPKSLGRVLHGGAWKVEGGEKTLMPLAARVVVSNLDVSRDPNLRDVVLPRAVIDRGGKRIGIVGAVTEAVADYSNVGDAVRVLPYVESVQREVDALTAEGVTIIVLLSHSGTAVDLANAPKIKGVDVIVAGHDHALIGDAKSLEDGGIAASAVARIKGPYPLHAKGKDGHDVVVVSAYEWGRVLGRIDVTFDAAGQVTGSAGAPIVLGASVHADDARDPALEESLAQLRAPVDALGSTEVATLPRGLPRGPKGQTEFGVVVAEGMLAAAKRVNRDVVGAIADGDARGDLTQGRLTMGKLIEIMPFENEIKIASLTGEDLERVVAHGLSAEPPYQLAGMTARIAPMAAPGEKIKIVDLRVLGRPVSKGSTYAIAVDDYIGRGAEGFTWLKEAESRATGVSVRDALAAELRAHPTGRAVAGRVTEAPAPRAPAKTP